MSHAESPRDEFIRKTGKDILHVYEERGFVKVIVHEGTVGSNDRSLLRLDPKSAQRAADKVEEIGNEETANELRSAADKAALTRFSLLSIDGAMN